MIFVFTFPLNNIKLKFYFELQSCILVILQFDALYATSILYFYDTHKNTFQLNDSSRYIVMLQFSTSKDSMNIIIFVITRKEELLMFHFQNVSLTPI